MPVVVDVDVDVVDDTVAADAVAADAFVDGMRP